MTAAPSISECPRTKIVCTLGPATSSREAIERLIDAGMNVARLNFSHGEHATHAKNIGFIRDISREKDRPIAILQDLQGPKIRTGKMLNGGLQIQKGQTFRLRYGLEQTEEGIIPIDFRELPQDTSVGSRILLDDGLLGMRVTGIKGDDVLVEVLYGGLLKSRKGVNFPDNPLSIPSMTEKDTRDLLFGVAQGVDYVALSFVRSAGDVMKLKQMLRALGSETPVVSKVEMLSAVENIDDICRVSDAIMVARGDLGVEGGFANVASFQKRIVASARKFGKPVIVATQMLDSMIENARPTKAEISDVANAVFDLADATMLSGETASGKHPTLCVETMRDILDRVDHSGKLETKPFAPLPEDSVPEAFAAVAADVAARCNAAAIVCLTLTGNIARTVARYRPYTPVIALTPRPDVVRKLSLVRGVYGVQNTIFYDTDVAISKVGKTLAAKGLVQEGDLIVITGGIPVTAMNPTNTVKLHRITKDDFKVD